MSKDGFGISLLESGEMMKKSYSSLVGNAGKTTAVLTLIIAALVTFTEVGFYELGTASLTSSAVIMLIASYLIYFSMEDAGERLGEESEVFALADKKYKSALDGIHPEDIGKLREFCARYSECELDFRRRNRILSLGLSLDDFERYKNGGSFTKNEMKRLRSVARMRPVALTPEMLLERDKTKSKSELSDPERTKALRLAARLIPTTLCTLFTATVMLSAKDGLTATTVIEGLFKLSALPIIGFKGYSAGYSYAKGARCAWIDTKTRLLEAFIAERA